MTNMSTRRFHGNSGWERTKVGLRCSGADAQLFRANGGEPKDGLTVKVNNVVVAIVVINLDKDLQGVRWGHLVLLESGFN